MNQRWPRLPRQLTDFESLAGPSASSSATPQLEFTWTPRFLERAERRFCMRAIFRQSQKGLSGSAQMIDIGSETLIGPTGMVRNHGHLIDDRRGT